MSTNQAPPILVSACLLGQRCRYDGACKVNQDLAMWLMGRPIIAVCPEVMGGLPVPRPPAVFLGGSGNDVWDGNAALKTAEGREVTRAFIQGAEKTAALCRQYGVRQAILKARSPSCGKDQVALPDGGTFPGHGVTASLLMRMGIHVHACEFNGIPNMDF